MPVTSPPSGAANQYLHRCASDQRYRLQGLIVQKLMQFYVSLVLLATVTSSWATTSFQDQQQLRSQADQLAIEALLHYDTDPRAGTRPDASTLETLGETRRKLKEMALRLSESEEIAGALEGMDASLEELSGLSREQAGSYASALITLLDQRAELNRLLDIAATGQPVSQLEQALNRQSRLLSEILLHALARNAAVLGQHSTAFYEAGLSPQDQAIELGFDELKTLLPGTEEKQLQRQHLAYRFVAPSLLIADTLQRAGAAERYISGIVTWLDQQAINAVH